MTETEALDRYIEEHSASEGDYLYRLWRAENIHTIHGRMSSGHVEGRVLKMLVQMIRPRTILEIGTFCGYSAICMAEGLADIEKAGFWEDDTALSASAFSSGENPTIQPMVYTFEINDELEDFTRSWIEGSPVADYICFTIGDAKVEAPKLGVTFDMAFLDGNKRDYIADYEMTLSLLRKGGYILADNTLWDGHVVDAAYDNDAQTQGIRQFNDFVARDARVEQVILPLRDGLTLIRKK